MTRLPFLTALTLALSACATSPVPLASMPTDSHLTSKQAPKTSSQNIPQPVTTSIPLPPPQPITESQTYSVVVNNVKVHDLLFALARDAQLNIDIFPGIEGYVTLNAIDQTLPQLLSRIADQVDIRYEIKGPNLSIMPDTPFLKTYQVDYVNMSRDVTGTISTNTQIATSSATDSTTTGSSGNNTSRIRIENKSTNHFWPTLEQNIRLLLQETDKERFVSRHQTSNQSSTATSASEEATSPLSATDKNTSKEIDQALAANVISNPEAGIISVRATAKQHRKVQEFLDQVTQNARRQVLIEATIVEVSLSDGYQQGIDWQHVTGNSTFGVSTPTSSSNTGSSINPFVLTYNRTASGITSTIDLLRSYGSVKVISSPKLSVLNNQTATLKVTEDFVYFNVKSDTTTTSNVGTTTGVTTTPQSVSVGFFMSLTAQISNNNSVTLNVRPSISSISELKEDPNPTLTAASNYVPQIKTREIESMMRLNSGEIAVLGGLMEESVDNRTNRIPGFGDVPLIGELFNKRDNASSKKELVILLRPTVIKDPSLSGDFNHLKHTLPSSHFFQQDNVFKPFGYSQSTEPKP